VYAAIAATLLAGLDGIDKALVPPEPCDVDLYAVAASGAALPPALPRTLIDALDCLANDTVLAEALGHEFVEQFLVVKRQEWSEFHQAVSDWELNRYADAY
jgi:glutamine synthetase